MILAGRKSIITPTDMKLWVELGDFSNPRGPIRAQLKYTVFQALVLLFDVYREHNPRRHYWVSFDNSFEPFQRYIPMSLSHVRPGV
jgi:hypothetical protein